MYKWYLPTLSEIIALSEPTEQPLGNSSGFPAQQRVRAEREWRGAIAALNGMLQQAIEPTQLTSDPASLSSAPDCDRGGGPTLPAVPTEPVKGLVLSGPAAVLDQLELIASFATWTFTVGAARDMLHLLPAADRDTASAWAATPTLPLLPSDPLAAEQFCLVLTPQFSLVMVLGETSDGAPAFLFSFEPDVVWQVWRSLQARLKLAAPVALAPVETLVNQFPPVLPDYRIVARFTRLMLANLPDQAESEGKRVQLPVGQSLQGTAQMLAAKPIPPDASGWPKRQAWPAARTGKHPPAKAAASKFTSANPARSADKLTGTETSFDTELLQAIAHEVRTPLTTIRTLTRLLLKRKDLSPDVIKRLEIIDRECTEQIDRFSLIFKAVELETANIKSPLTPLAPIPLSQVIQQNIPRWQQQVSQHNHTLDVILPQTLPMVITDPTMLDQALTGLIDRITHSLPPGSHIQVRVTLAGHQLKLQFESQPQAGSEADGKLKFGFTPALKSIGQLLMFQPETGNLSLNMAVTKNLFQVLGGKLIVRQRPQQGEVLTIFLPLETRKLEES